MSGRLAAIKLRMAGHTDIAVYEKADHIGGTWRDNSYLRQLSGELPPGDRPDPPGEPEMPVSSANASKLVLLLYAGVPEPAVQVLLANSMKQEALAACHFISVSRTVIVFSLRLPARTFERGHPLWPQSGTCFSNRMR